MKSLNKMIASAAAMATMCFGAKAGESKEVDFMPVQNGGEINKIELVNGQLLVRCTDEAEIQGVKTPYVYVGTNTQNFASNAFAQGGLTNVNQYVHAGNGKIYMTEKGTNTIWTTEVKAPEAALNGVTLGVKKLNSTNSFINQALQGGLVVVDEDDDRVKYVPVENKVKRIDADGSVHNNDRMNSSIAGKKMDAIIILKDGEEQKRSFVLVEGKVYSAQGKLYNGKPADAIAKTEDGKLLILNGSEKQVYDPKTGEFSVSEPIGMDISFANGVKSSVVSKDGKTIYYATAKKLGYKTLD